MTTPVVKAPTARRLDPDRRNRIIDACLAVIAREGVAGTSHRRVAAEADVPLGSMTYYFSGMAELLTEAFTRFADRAAADVERRFGECESVEDARALVAALIDEGSSSDPQDLVITHELYTLAARQPSYRNVTHRWLEHNRRTLERFFDPATARIVDALIEGLTLHQALDTRRRDQRLASAAIHRVTSEEGT
jgi:DNA-binding transcriptional regulator YbjK